MTRAPGVVGVTGANGYLGSAIVAELHAKGWSTVALVRNPDRFTADAARRYDANEPVDPSLLAGIDTLVHCAYDMSARHEADIWRTNVSGSRRLLDAAKGTVARTVVLSSMSAYAGTRQLYGRAKLAIEDHAARIGACVVRPGLVYGPRPGGMTAALSRLGRLPLVPLIGSASHQFTVHEDDFVAAIRALVEYDDTIRVPVGVAHPEPVSFRHILSTLAGTDGRPPRFVPVNWRLVYGGMRAAEGLGLPLPVRADSVLGLAHPAPSVPNVDVLTELGVHLRPFGTVDRFETRELREDIHG